MKKSILIISILFFLAAAAFAQEPAAILEYFDDFSGEFKVVTLQGEEWYSDTLDFGMEVPIGSTIVTFDGDYAEISLDPNGSIIRISENTNFSIDALQGASGAAENVFSIAVGKFRAVAGRATGDERYIYKGPSAVCGVRGTDSGMSVIPGQLESAFVFEGSIEFTNALGESVVLGAGMVADAMADVFEAAQMSSAMMQDLMSGLEFEKLDKASVPGHEPPAEVSDADKADKEAPEDDGGLFGKLLELLGVEIGSVTIEEKTWAKAIIQPRFVFGKWKIALYLPIIYESDMLDPSSWYRPDGNDEWSFGHDQSEWDEVALDFLEDLFLKIRYIEYGEQRDPFFFKVGNLNNITIGHGMIMRNYANDADFPAVRKIGINLGLDGEKGGFEAMVNDVRDVTNIDVFGARLYARPMGSSFPLAVGISGVMDINPGEYWQDFPDLTYGNFGKPFLLSGGLDLDFPVLENDLMSIILFADVAAMLPYFQEAVPGTSISAGFAFEAIWDDSEQKFKNWGFASGFLGNVLMVDYRLEGRYFTGTFTPAIYNSVYDRKRHEYVQDIVLYLENQDNPKFDTKTLGIYGEATVNLGKKFYLGAGYLWPWYLDDTGVSAGPDDYFLFKAGVLKGGIPFTDIFGSLTYERTRFIPTLKDKGSLELFDANTVFTAELVYPVSPILNVAALVATNVFEDALGNLESHLTVSIVTRVNY